HSPACALHLRRLIAERRPTHVLIEGPTAFDKFVDLLASPSARPPLALFSYCSEKLEAGAPAASDGKRRRGPYYPVCDYSPEWTPLREGLRVGAQIRFIDLDFHKQICIDHSDRLTSRLSMLISDRYFARSAYLRRLAQERGCRNHDELWDQLFEAWAERVPT